MQELPSIKKVIAGSSVNTDTSSCFHLETRLVTEKEGEEIKQRAVTQGLYQAPDGQYFVAFWNKMVWDDETMGYDFIEEISLITPEKAMRWIGKNCPDKLQELMESMDKKDKSTSLQTVSIRMSQGLRERIDWMAQGSNRSISKVCVDLINRAIELGYRPTTLSAPNQQGMCRMYMPDEKGPALDEFGTALSFDDPEDQELAGHAETLLLTFNLDYQKFLPFAIRILYRLMHVKKNEKQTTCFVNWLTLFYRVSQGENAGYEHLQEKLPIHPSMSARWGNS